MEINQEPYSVKDVGKKAFLQSLLFPALFVILIWIVELLQVSTGVRLISLGVIPREIAGLPGILTAPFIHSGYDHLISNTLPLLVVGAGLFYFYPTLAWRVVVLVWSLTGIWVWLAGRTSSHIGASGLIYGYVCFLFFSGLLRKDTRLIAISLLVTFLYGSLVWGILPVDQTVSWESHFFGAVAGTMCAFYFRKDGPQRKKAQWEIDEENELRDTMKINADQETITNISDNGIESNQGPSPIHIRYIYKQDDDESQADKGF